MTKIKVGLLIREFENLSDTEFRIYEKLFDSEYLKIEVLLKDGRRKIKKKFTRFLNFDSFSKLLFILINNIDLFFFDKKFLEFKDKNKIISKLKSIEQIYLYPTKKKYYDWFDSNEISKLKKYNLDIILRNEFNIIKGEILNLPKYGIWSFHHGDNDYYRGGPAGFWEVLNNENTTGVTLQILNNNLDGGDIIEKGYFPTQQTYIRNNSFILEKSASILLKNIKLLYYNSKISTYPSKSTNYKIYKYPNKIIYIFKYLIVLLNNLFLNKLINKFYHLMNFRLSMWSLFIIKNDIFSNKINKLIPIIAPKGFFYADPFLVSKNNEYFLFFENYSYKKNKGKISCGVLKNDKLTNINDVISSEKHYSYPFIFNYENKFYLIPESHQSNRLEIYISINFPYKWKLYSTAFNGSCVADPTIFLYKKNLWLFLNKSSEPFKDLSSELYIYKISDLKFNNIIPHKKNPVIVDSKKARNAGSIFEKNGKIYRPSQSNIKSVYGHSLNISEITKLSCDDYEEKLVKIIEPNFYKNLIATHHLTLSDSFYIIDGCFDFYK